MENFGGEILIRLLKRLFKINNLITLVAVATTIFVLYNTQEKELRVDCVPNEEVAIEIGKAICMKAYPEIDYDNIVWRCTYYEVFKGYEEDFWVVSWHPENRHSDRTVWGTNSLGTCHFLEQLGDASLSVQNKKMKQIVTRPQNVKHFVFTNNILFL